MLASAERDGDGRTIVRYGSSRRVTGLSDEVLDFVPGSRYLRCDYLQMDLRHLTNGQAFRVFTLSVSGLSLVHGPHCVDWPRLKSFVHRAFHLDSELRFDLVGVYLGTNDVKSLVFPGRCRSPVAPRNFSELFVRVRDSLHLCSRTFGTKVAFFGGGIPGDGCPPMDAFAPRSLNLHFDNFLEAAGTSTSSRNRAFDELVSFFIGHVHRFGTGRWEFTNSAGADPLDCATEGFQFLAVRPTRAAIGKSGTGHPAAFSYPSVAVNLINAVNVALLKALPSSFRPDFLFSPGTPTQWDQDGARGFHRLPARVSSFLLPPVAELLEVRSMFRLDRLFSVSSLAFLN